MPQGTVDGIVPPADFGGEGSLYRQGRLRPGSKARGSSRCRLRLRLRFALGRHLGGGSLLRLPHHPDPAARGGGVGI